MTVRAGFEFEIKDAGATSILDKVADLLDLLDRKSEKSLDQINEGLNDIAKSYPGITGSIERQKKAIGNLIDEKKKDIKLTDDQIKAQQLLSDIYKREKEVLKDRIKDLDIFGINIGKVVGVYKQLRLVIGLGIKSLGAFRVALIATGVGAFVVALGSVVAFLSKMQSGIDLVNRKTQFLRGLLQPTITLINRLGESLVNAFTNPIDSINSLVDKINNFSLTDFFNNASSGIKEFTKETISSAKAFENLENRRQSLIRTEIELRKTFAETRAEIELNKKISEDQTKNINERSAAAIKAAQLEQDLLRKVVLARNSALKIAQEESLLSSDPNSIANLEKIAEATERLNDAREDSFGKQTELQNKLNDLNRQRQEQIEAEKKRIEELIMKYEALKQTLDDQVLELELSGLDELERQRRELELTDEALDTYRETLIKAAKDAGLGADAIDDINEKINTLKANVARQIGIVIDIQTLNADGIDDIDALETQQLNVPIRATPDITLDFSSSEKTKEQLREELQDLFQEIEETTSAIAEGITIGAEIFSNIVDTQIEDLDRLIDARKNTISGLEEDLDIEEKLYRQGAANRFQITKDELDREQQLLQEDEEKRRQLREKQLKAELAANLATQASSLVTAIANTFASNSSIPLVGYVLALTQIASMIAAFTAFKSQISALEEGGSVREALSNTGYIKKQGKQHTRSGHERYGVIDNETGRHTGVTLRGDEWVSDPDISKEHEVFFRDMKENKEFYRGKNLLRIVRQEKMDVKPIQLRTIATQSHNLFITSKEPVEHLTKDDMTVIMDKHLSGMINKLEVSPMPDGRFLLKRGDNTVIKNKIA